jgi:hypothetical protein
MLIDANAPRRLLRSSNRSLTISRTFTSLFLIFPLVLILSYQIAANESIAERKVSNFQAQATVDLDQLLAKGAAVKGYSLQCNGDNCPPIDCPTAQKLNDELIEALYFSKYQYYWLRVASKNHGDLYRRAAESVTRDAARQARLQIIVAYQEYVTNIAGAMLDIAGASASLDSLSKNTRNLEDMSASEFLGHLDALYEGAKSFESSANTISGSTSNRPKVFNISSDELNNHKSTVSDIRTLVQEAMRNGRDWRATVRSGNAISSLGQIVGRYAKAFANEEIEERKRLADSLSTEVAVGERAMTAAFREWVRYQNRRNQAEDVYRLMKDVYSSSGTGSWGRCMGKLSIACGAFRTTATGRVPDFAQVTFYGENFDLAVADRPGEWGRAVQYFDGIFSRLSNNLAAIDIKEVSPTITVAKLTLKPGEDFGAGFTAPACYSPDSWIGIVKSNVPHGSEPTNSNNTSRKQRLQRRQEGQTQFAAPQEPGSYDLRMNDPASGKEVASVTFRVEPDTVETPPETYLFDNSNPAGTLNGPERPTVFSLDREAKITTLITYHWNSGRGAQPGTIALRDENGKVYGPFSASGSSGHGGAPNVNWTAKTSFTVPAGTYTILASDRESWSNNAESGFAGIARVRGHLLDKSPVTAASDNNLGKVMIYFGANRQVAAEKAATILRENGWTIELRGGAKFNKGEFRKMYFAPSGSKEKAVKIAMLLQAVESLTPVAANPPQGFDWNYLVFLQDPSEITLEWNTNAHWANVRPFLNLWVRTFYCPANPSKKEVGSVSGSDIYYYASAVCPAAVHAGRITFQTGGLVTVQAIKGEDFPNVVGSERNGVKSESVNGVFWSYKFID